MLKDQFGIPRTVNKIDIPLEEEPVGEEKKTDSQETTDSKPKEEVIEESVESFEDTQNSKPEESLQSEEL